MVVTAYYNDNTTVDLTEGFTCAPELFETPGTQTVTVTYEGKTATFEVNVIAVVIDRIEVKTAPAKTSYFTGDKLDATGLELNVIYNNGKVEIVDAGFTCDLDVLDVAGEQTVTVTYGDKTDTFNINVTQLEVTSIEVLTAPDKTELFVGETLDTTGLTIQATYNSGKTETVDSGFECTPTEFTTAGEHTITVTYEGCTTTFKVNLTAVLTEIKVTTKPSKVTYFEGDSLDAAGMVVTAYYNDNTTVDLTEGFICDPELLETPGKQTVTVTYDGQTTTFEVNVIKVVAVNIEMVKNPSKVDYLVGEVLDTAGLTLKVTYNNGDVETVTNGFICAPEEFTSAGEHTITVTYEDCTTTFKAFSTAVLTGISVKTKPSKLDYFEGEELNTAGMVVTAYYNDNTTVDLTDSFTCAPGLLETPGKQAVTVTYEGATTTFEVNVIKVVIDRIEIKTQPVKTEYFTGDSLDTTGLTLDVIYNNGNVETVDKGFECDYNIFGTAGRKNVVVTYNEKTTEFSVNVTAVAVERIEIKTLPNKTDYFTGQTLNTTGLTITAFYNNGTVKNFDRGYTCDPNTFSKEGTQTVTVTYEGKTAAFTVNVTREVKRIEIITKPNKTTYFVGDTLDTTGIVIAIIYADGSGSYTSSSFTCDVSELNSVGTKTVTVTCKGKTATFTVTVVQKGRIKSVSLEDCVVKHKKEKKLEPNIAVEGSINYTVKFVSSTPSVFEIDDSGNIKTVSKGKGTAICIVTDEYGNVYEARCTVKVKYTFGQILLKIFLPWIKL